MGSTKADTDPWPAIVARTAQALTMVRRDMRRATINAFAFSHSVNASTVQRAVRAVSFAKAYKKGKLEDEIYGLPLLAVDALERWERHDPHGAQEALKKALKGGYPVVDIIADERQKRQDKSQKSPRNKWVEDAVAELLTEHPKLQRVPPLNDFDPGLPVDAWLSGPRRDLIAVRVLGEPTFSAADYNKAAKSAVIMAHGVALLAKAKAWLALPEWGSDRRYEDMATRFVDGLVSVKRLRKPPPF